MSVNEGADQPPAPDHHFMWTVTGRCARSGCGKTSDGHPKRLPAPQDGCTVDHSSIQPKLKIDDSGSDWTRCPACNIRVEGGYDVGQAHGAVGPATGRGRFPFTKKHLSILEAMRPSWLDGMRS